MINTIPYSTAFVTGIISGTTQCTIACAPFISTYIMGSREGVLDGIKSFTAFTVGRVFMYAVIGLVSGYIGTTFVGMEKNLPYLSLIFGFILISIGLLMLIRPVSTNCNQSKGKIELFGFISRRVAFNPTTHLFVMGMAFAAIPCPPMAGILVYSLKMPSVISSSILMSLFGIGTAFSPLIVISALSGWFSRKIKTEVPQYKMMFQRISGIILMFLGVSSAVF
ncbi:MAG: sulfite exporter TauE/SafE family protein [Deltaproteobacteria bacterium]|nr:sulfite exporter TauE/SafE family protein [Deltaproteobacteria bacterium]